MEFFPIDRFAYRCMHRIDAVVSDTTGLPWWLGDNIWLVAREDRMPFDCTPVFDDLSKPSPAIGGDGAEFRTVARTAGPIRVRPIPAWYINGRAERVEAAIAVLARARYLIADEPRWCKRSLARGWLEMPVPVRSAFARRFCAIGAIQRAAGELGLPMKDAGGALEWQTVRPVPDWNDDPCRTNDEVVAAFDAAIVSLEVMPA